MSKQHNRLVELNPSSAPSLSMKTDTPTGVLQAEQAEYLGA